MIDALWMTSVGMFRSDARRSKSECVVALSFSLFQSHISLAASATHPRGSPTTRNEISTVSAFRKISSDSSSTVSRVAMITSRP